MTRYDPLDRLELEEHFDALGESIGWLAARIRAWQSDPEAAIKCYQSLAEHVDAFALAARVMAETFASTP